MEFHNSQDSQNDSNYQKDEESQNGTSKSKDTTLTQNQTKEVYVDLINEILKNRESHANSRPD